jgi:NAD(P)H-dependent flavin oxidoreductase YrpB (nitropropane dioxygenase family)
MEEIPEAHHAYARMIHRKYDVPLPKNPEALRSWGGMNKTLGRSQLEVLLEERVPVIATGLGSPDFLIDAAHERDLKVFGLVGMRHQAERQVARGVDAVVAQGYDAAGHVGGIGTYSLVADVTRVAGDTPVIAAGGITTGRHLAAALCLGASGVWTGTAWLLSNESDIEPVVKERIRKAGSDDTSRNPYISGKTMRVLRCPWTEEWDKPEAPKVLKSPYQMLLSSEYIQASNDHLRGDLMTEAVGQGVGFVNEARPCREILHEMADEARSVFERLVT